MCQIKSKYRCPNAEVDQISLRHLKPVWWHPLPIFPWLGTHCLIQSCVWHVTCVTYSDSLVLDKSHKLCDSLYIYTYYANREIGMHTIQRKRHVCCTKCGKRHLHEHSWVAGTSKLQASPSVYDMVASWNTWDLTCRRNLNLLVWWDGICGDVSSGGHTCKVASTNPSYWRPILTMYLTSPVLQKVYYTKQLHLVCIWKYAMR